MRLCTFYYGISRVYTLMSAYNVSWVNNDDLLACFLCEVNLLNLWCYNIKVCTWIITFPWKSHPLHMTLWWWRCVHQIKMFSPLFLLLPCLSSPLLPLLHFLSPISSFPAAFNYLKGRPADPIDTDEFEHHCGVGVVVTEKEINEKVCKTRKPWNVITSWYQ